jgi:hypothetical protein
MTALNVIQTNEAIHFFSDGAYVDPRSNSLVAIGQKVFAFPHARCAIGISGPMELCNHLGMGGQGCVTIDQLVGDIENVLPKMIEIVLPDGYPAQNIGIYIGGFSSEGERQLYKLDARTTDRSFKFIRCDADCWNYQPRLTPFTIRQALGNECGDEFDRGFIERLANPDPIAHGMLALEAQRRIKVCDSGLAGGSAYTVGAFAQVTSVYIDRVESRILERWSDQIGAPISPDGTAKVHQFGFGSISYQPQRAIGFKGANDTANGIDTGNSSNYAVDTTNGFVAPTLGVGSLFGDSAASYTASKGTGTGTLSSIFQSTVGLWAASSAGVPSRVSFDLGPGVASNCSQVILQWHYAGTKTGTIDYSDDGTNWTTAASFNTSASIDTDFTVTVNEASAHRYWSVNLTAYAGSTVTTFFKAQFYAAGPTNMTLVTAAQTADASVSKARVLLEYDNTASPTLNTDLTVEVTCDGGANWSAGTLTKFSSHLQDGHHGAETELVSCTPGTSVAARIKTANGKNVPIHALALQWE